MTIAIGSQLDHSVLLVADSAVTCTDDGHLAKECKIVEIRPHLAFVTVGEYSSWGLLQRILEDVCLDDGSITPRTLSDALWEATNEGTSARFAPCPIAMNGKLYELGSCGEFTPKSWVASGSGGFHAEGAIWMYENLDGGLLDELALERILEAVYEFNGTCAGPTHMKRFTAQDGSDTQK